MDPSVKGEQMGYEQQNTISECTYVNARFLHAKFGELGCFVLIEKKHIVGLSEAGWNGESP